EALRRAAPGTQVGITLNLAHSYPATDSPEDEAAAWRVDGEGNRWFLDPIFRAAYPADLLERNEIVAGFVRDADLAAIAAPLDFLGVNNYFRFVVSAGADGPPPVPHPEAGQPDFEWAHGYSKRFGIVYVDYPTLERVPKDSFYWYRDFIASRRGAPRPSPIPAG